MNDDFSLFVDTTFETGNDRLDEPRHLSSEEGNLLNELLVGVEHHLQSEGGREHLEDFAFVSHCVLLGEISLDVRPDPVCQLSPELLLLYKVVHPLDFVLQNLPVWVELGHQTSDGTDDGSRQEEDCQRLYVCYSPGKIRVWIWKRSSHSSDEPHGVVERVSVLLMESRVPEFQKKLIRAK